MVKGEEVFVRGRGLAADRFRDPEGDVLLGARDGRGRGRDEQEDLLGRVGGGD